MNDSSNNAWGARRVLPALATGALAVALAACSSGGTIASFPNDLGGTPSDDFIPTFPPDDLASDLSTCIDEPTMAIVDQLRAPGADVPSILAANKDALISGLADLESADPATTDWRDSLLTALDAGDMAAATAQVAVLVAGDLTITPC